MDTYDVDCRIFRDTTMINKTRDIGVIPRTHIVANYDISVVV